MLGELAAVIRSDPDQKDLLDRIQARVLELVKQATIDTPNDSNAWCAAGKSAAGSRRNIESRRFVFRALVLDYGNTNLRLQLANLLATIGRRDEAIRSENLPTDQPANWTKQRACWSV